MACASVLSPDWVLSRLSIAHAMRRSPRPSGSCDACVGGGVQHRCAPALRRGVVVALWRNSDTLSRSRRSHLRLAAPSSLASTVRVVVGASSCGFDGREWYVKALVIIDMLDDFVDGALANPRARAIVPSLRRILEQARCEGWVVVFSNDAHRPGDP